MALTRPAAPTAPRTQAALLASQLKRKLEDKDSADIGPTIKKPRHQTGVSGTGEKVYIETHKPDISNGDVDFLYSQSPPTKPPRLSRSKSF